MSPAFPAAARAAPAWLSPQSISEVGNHGDASTGEDMQVAIGPHGGAVAIWRRYNGGMRILQAATRAPGGDWGPPQDLSPGQDAAFSRLAVDLQGNAVATWAGTTGGKLVAMAATRPAAGGPVRDGWSPPAQLSAAGEGTHGVPEVAVDSQGNALAIWLRQSDQTPQVASRPAGAGWSAPQDLSPPGEPGTPDAPQIAIDGAGNAVAIWMRSVAGAFIVEGASRPAGGSWSAQPHVLSAPGHEVAFPLLRLDAQGDAVALWLSAGDDLRLHAATRPAAGGAVRDGWSVSQAISGTGQLHYAGLAVDPQGNAVAIWRALPPGELATLADRVYAATRPAGGGWSDPQVIGPQPYNGPGVVIDHEGNAIAYWTRYIGDDVKVVQAAVRPAGASPTGPRGGWREWQDLSNSVGNADLAQVAVDPLGNATAIWLRADGVNRTIEAVRRPSGTPAGTPRDGWSEPGAISESPAGTALEQFRVPKLAVDSQGNAVATWRHYSALVDGTDEAVVQAVGLDAAGPHLRDLVVPATGVAGSSLSFSVSAVDVWSDVASTVWSFGDGSSASGTSVSHAYAAPGRYEVTVTSTDSLGNSSSERRTVVVTAAAGGGPGAGGPAGAPGSGAPQGAGGGAGSGGSGAGGAAPRGSSTQAARLRGLRRCHARVRRHSGRERRRARRGSFLTRARRRAHMRRHARGLRRRCRARWGRTPGRVRGLRARALSRTKVRLSFIAAGTHGNRPPAAHTYLVKQSTRPIRGARGFRRARSLCRGRCRLRVGRVGRRVSLTVTGLRPRTTYRYAIAARDNVSRRLGRRSRSVRARTR